MGEPQSMLQPVLRSGGSGTRLWPFSREAYPKQFRPLVGKDTVLQATGRRVAALADSAPIAMPTLATCSRSTATTITPMRRGWGAGRHLRRGRGPDQ